MTDPPVAFSDPAVVRLFRHLPGIGWATDADLNFTASFGAALASIGLQEGEVVGKSALEYFAHGENGDLIVKKLRAALEGETVRFTVRWLDAHFLAAIVPLEDPAGRIAGTIGVAIETTSEVERDAAATELSRAMAQAETVAPIGNFTTDLELDLVTLSEQGRRIWGLSGNGPVTGSSFLERIAPGDRELLLETRKKALATGEPFSLRLRLLGRNGTGREARIFVSWLRDDKGAISRSIGTIVDLTPQIASELEIKRIAETDALTGLANRNAIAPAIDAAIGRYDRVAVVCLDVDHFTRLNDGLGHAVGDSILRAVADRLRTLTRRNDTVARVGADEFVCVITPRDPAVPLEEEIERFHAAVEKPYQVDGLMLQLFIHIGVSAYPRNGTEELLKKADIALYRARHNRAQSVEWYDVDLERQLLGEQQLAADLNGAAAGGELRLYYQPIVNALTGLTVAHEALLRWQHPTRGLLLPGSFLHLAEESHVMQEINEWTIERAMRDCAQSQLLGGDGRKIHINVSPRQLLATDMLEIFRRTLSTYRIRPESVAVEVTEQSFLTDFETASSVLRECRKLGASIVVDDFGTGYNTFHYLRELPVDCIKIDCAFVRTIDVDEHSEAIVRAMVALATSLQIAVVAEGVETAEQRNRLLHVGCREMQGFFYSAAVQPWTLA